MTACCGDVEAPRRRSLSGSVNAIWRVAIVAADVAAGEWERARDMDAAMNSRSEKLTIRDARVVVTCPGRNFVTLVIETDQGVTGIGDATLNGRELAVASYLSDHEIGRAHVCTQVTNAHIVCRLLLDKQKEQR